MKLSTMIVLAFLCLCGTKERYQISDKLLAAIEQVESGGRGDKTPDGDGGKAIGPFQIHECYWKDAVEFDKSIGGVYNDCRKLEYAKNVVRAYLRRYAGSNASDEKAARIHNGGPLGPKKKATAAYWEKVKKELK